MKVSDNLWCGFIEGTDFGRSEIANERYTEYAIEKLALVHSSVQEIHDFMEEESNRSSNGDGSFPRILEMLRQLKVIIVSLQSI